MQLTRIGESFDNSNLNLLKFDLSGALENIMQTIIQKIYFRITHLFIYFTNSSFNPDGEVIPGRSFNPEPPTEQSKAVINLLKREEGKHKIGRWTCHIDLHETTDTDDTEFRPAKAARDGVTEPPTDEIPDGFYLVSDSTKEHSEWNTAMIDAVRKVTHIAPADADGKIIGEKVVQEGVIAIPSPKSLGLCAGVTNAEFATTTEVYPDSPKATGEICNQAQIACIEGALEFILDRQEKKTESILSQSAGILQKH